MGTSKKMCCLPNIVTAGMVMEYYNLSCSEFDFIVESKGLTAFKTEYNRFYFSGQIHEAIADFIVESSEIDAAITQRSLPLFIETYKTMFQMKRPKEKARLDAIQSVFVTFEGDFADFIKSVVFDWQHDLCSITQKRFLTVLQRLEWLTTTGEKRLKYLEENCQE